MSVNYCKHGQPEGDSCDECAKKQEGVSSFAAPTGLDGDEILEALKECEYALKAAIEKDKVGWLQQVAHQTACDALNKHLAAKKNQAI